MGFDGSVIGGSKWILYRRETRDLHSVDAHEYVPRENHQHVSVVHRKMAVPIVSRRFIRADAEAAYRYYRGVPGRLLLLDGPLLPRPSRPSWTMLIAASWILPEKSTATMAVPSSLFCGESFGLGSIVIVTCYRRGVGSRFLVSSTVCWIGLSYVRARIDRCLLPGRLI